VPEEIRGWGNFCHLLASPTTDSTSTNHENDKLPSANPDLRCLGCTCSTTIPLPLLWVSCHCQRGSAGTAADDLTRTHEIDPRLSAAVSSAQLSSSSAQPSSCSLSIGPAAMSLYNMPPGAPQPSSSLSSESPLALAPTVGDLSSADLFGSGTTNGGGHGSAHGHGHGPGPGHGSASANGNENGSVNGTVTPSSTHDQGSQSGPTAVPAACLACVSSPVLLSLFLSLLVYSV
jgi:hypothetical protein